jgi:hypothetical protein
VKYIKKSLSNRRPQCGRVHSCFLWPLDGERSKNLNLFVHSQPGFEKAIAISITNPLFYACIVLSGVDATIVQFCVFVMENRGELRV